MSLISDFVLFVVLLSSYGVVFYMGRFSVKLDAEKGLPEPRGPTLHAPDQAAIELLREIRPLFNTFGYAPEYIKKIDAVLKTAAAGG